jgi:hypothetical protein
LATSRLIPAWLPETRLQVIDETSQLAA